MENGPYLVPFAEVKKRLRIVSEKGQLKVTMSYEAFLATLRDLLVAVPMDEAFYKSAYPDVAEAVAAGIHGSVKQHFIENGYMEGRLPFPMRVDHAWYLAQNPDLKEGLESGEIGSLDEHFMKHGYQEGRRPRDPQALVAGSPSS